MRGDTSLWKTRVPWNSVRLPGSAPLFFCLAAGRGLGSLSVYLRWHQFDVVGDNMSIRQSGVRGGAGIQAPCNLDCLALRQGGELVVEGVVPDANGEKQWWSVSRTSGLNRPVDRDAEIGYPACAD